MADFEPVLLRRVGRPLDIWAYRADGGYRPLEKALNELQPPQIIQMVRDAGLRGRGGAGFSCGLKWSFLPKDHPGPIYLCVNIDESEPCTFNNRYLIENDPHQVIEGVLLACYATRATTAYLYFRYEYGKAARIMQQAIGEAYAHGLLGDNILGKGLNVNAYIHRGAGAYICGEETGLIESLEGKRAWPRIKPPYPAVEGAFRKPTVVNNPETLSCVVHIIDRGADWFKSLGIPSSDPARPERGSYGPKLYNLSGHINKPGTFEIPMGITTQELIDKYGGGVWKGKKAKGAIPGGLSTGILTAAEFDARLDYDDLARYEIMGLGTAAVTVFDEDTSIVDVVYNIARFFSHESCGQCTPCREGTGWMLQILERMRAGQGRREDLDILADVGDRIGIIPGTTICGLSDGAGWPIKNAVKKFRAEFEAYIKSGQKKQTVSLALAHH
ncbi:MAG: NADH-quinone oxidoreductase subunit NuoF [Planctomycetes bacterium]|nr:NADH-quinone oxidoreductase subunit NuoF [Planctomycetota bacterium]